MDADGQADLPVDLGAVRARYRAERDKRLREGDRQSLLPGLSGPGARWVEDPHTPVVEREPFDDEVDVVIVGAGFGGLLVAAQLVGQGVRRIRLIDAAGDVGGVWYWNRYPGAMCDVESLVYMPLLEEMNYVPRDRYASAAEILGHAQRIARHYGLYEDALFHTEVTSLRWMDDGDAWNITTNRGDSIRARFVVLALGLLNRVKVPNLPGAETFGGKLFHTSRWDYSYTGGGPNEPLSHLSDKVVGILGTGATALQCVPPLGRSAKQLYVFQRTPSTVAVRANGPIDPEWVRSMPPGWQQERQDSFAGIFDGTAGEFDLVADGWSKLMRGLAVKPTSEQATPEEIQRARELADFTQMEAVRQRIAEHVVDPRTAEALKPYYAYWCKRPGFHDEYLETFNRPNVDLVDTAGKGVERFFEHGVIANDKKYELDCLIMATGFESETAGKLEWGFDVFGRKGLPLAEKWAHGLSTLHGIMTRDFPNLLILPGVNAQSAVTINVVYAIQINAEQIGYIIGEAHRRNAATIEPDDNAETAWIQTLLDRAVDRSAFLAACTPGRTNYEGAGGRPPQNINYDGPIQGYRSILTQWRDAGTMPGMELTYDRRHTPAGTHQQAPTPR